MAATAPSGVFPDERFLFSLIKFRRLITCPQGAVYGQHIKLQKYIGTAAPLADDGISAGSEFSMFCAYGFINS